MSVSLTNAAGWLLNDRPLDWQTVGVIGAGTMGAGIAQVAAAAGHPVLLLDAREGAAHEARERIAIGLDTLVRKEKMTGRERDALLARITTVGTIADLREASLVIEVIVEQLEAKRVLIRELESHLNRNAIIASNTSSMSITALANGMMHPERLVGMHFFNPVPQMKLVEVVSGTETAASVAALIFDTAKLWGKTPVHATSTPGFIVNRIARPYYAEALALLQEQAANPEDIDRAARSAGFRMGPCELMDLIGHDVNYLVTVSVFEANYGDRRYLPSLVQKALVDGGRLGRKSGKGFYDGAASPAVLPPPDRTATESVRVAGQGPVAQLLIDKLRSMGVETLQDSDADWVGLRLAGVELHVTDGRTAARIAAERRCACTAVMDLPLLSGAERALAIAFAPAVPPPEREALKAALESCGIRPVEYRDVAGLLLGRTIAMLINEASDAVWQGVCDEPGADTAMKLGTNYPAGPFEWLHQLGVDHAVVLLNNLFDACRSERYRVSPLLQQRFWMKKGAL